jgi:hypothetical protein
MTLEKKIYELQGRYGLTTVSFFTSDLPFPRWRVFGSRRNAKGFQESVLSGGGAIIDAALESLIERAEAGPINKPYVPILDAGRNTVSD